jgi:hypothetical protein
VTDIQVVENDNYVTVADDGDDRPSTSTLCNSKSLGPLSAQCSVPDLDHHLVT